MDGEEIWGWVHRDCAAAMDVELYELVFRAVAERMLLISKGIEFEKDRSSSTSFEDRTRSRNNALAVLAIVASAFPEFRRRAYDFEARERKRQREERFEWCVYHLIQDGLAVALPNDSEATSSSGAVTYALTARARAFSDWVSHQADRRLLYADWETALARFEEQSPKVGREATVMTDGRATQLMAHEKGK